MVHWLIMISYLIMTASGRRRRAGEALPIRKLSCLRPPWTREAAGYYVIID